MFYQLKSRFSFLFGKYAWTILSIKDTYSSTLFSFNTYFRCIQNPDETVYMRQATSLKFNVNGIIFSFSPKGPSMTICLKKIPFDIENVLLLRLGHCLTTSIYHHLGFSRYLLRLT